LSGAERTTPKGGTVEAPGVLRNVLRGSFAALLAALMAGGGYLLLQWEPRHLPVRVVTVNGEVRHLSRERLVQAVVDHLHGGIVTQDLDELKGAVEAMPWVRSASLRRVWPDCLELQVVEREPLARWNDDGLVTADGVVFRPHDDRLPDGLPRLAGPDEQALTVVQRFTQWRRRLAARGLSLDAVTLDARGAWTLTLAAGFTVHLGTAQIDERLGRLLYAYPSLTAAGRPETVDMRYSNGLAVLWSDAIPDSDGRTAGSSAAANLLPRPVGARPGHSRS
jgi:cell division protein FtsQ